MRQTREAQLRLKIKKTYLTFFITLANNQKTSASHHVAVSWFVVLGGAEADQALLEHEYSEWVT